MTRLALLERLKQLQQMPAFQKRDITTVSALLTKEALIKHVELCEATAGVPDQPIPHDGRSEGGVKHLDSRRA